MNWGRVGGVPGVINRHRPERSARSLVTGKVVTMARFLLLVALLAIVFTNNGGIL